MLMVMVNSHNRSRAFTTTSYKNNLVEWHSNMFVETIKSLSGNKQVQNNCVPQQLKTKKFLKLLNVPVEFGGNQLLIFFMHRQLQVIRTPNY